MLEDDASFLMGHVLVGASQCLTPLMHQDALDAVAKLNTATELAQANGTCFGVFCFVFVSLELSSY